MAIKSETREIEFNTFLNSRCQLINGTIMVAQDGLGPCQIISNVPLTFGDMRKP